MGRVPFALMRVYVILETHIYLLVPIHRVRRGEQTGCRRIAKGHCRFSQAQ